MGQGKISRLSIQLFLLDIVFTPVGLYIASQLRILLPYGEDLPDEAASLPWQVYLIAAICWSIALALNGTYDPQRVLSWFNEALRVGSAAILATGLLAGALFLTYRETSPPSFRVLPVGNLTPAPGIPRNNPHLG